MRADNNWEDSIGKKLFEFEGDLSPQAWNNINKKIQPKRRNRWFIWLPVVLFFCGLPLALHYANRSGLIHLGSEKSTTKLSQTTQNDPDKIAITRSEKPSGNEKTTLIESPEPVENTLKQNDRLAQQDNKFSENLPEDQSTSKTKLAFGSKTSKPELLPALIAEKPKKLSTEDEKNGEENAIEKQQKSKNVIRNHTTGKTLIAATSKPKITDFNSSQKQKAAGKIGSENKELSVINSAESPVAKTSSVQPKTTTSFQSGTEKNTGSINSSADSKKEPNQSPAPTSTLSITAENSSVVKAKSDSATLAKTEIKLPEETIPVDSSTSEKKEKEKKKLSFLIYGTPQYTVQQVAPNNQDEILILKLNNKNDFSSKRIGYEFGLRTYYPLNNKLQLEFGLHFARLNQHINLTTASQLADSVVTISQKNPVKLEVFNKQLNEDFNLKYFYSGLFIGSNVALGQNLKVTAGLGLNALVAAKPKDTARELESKTFNPYVSAGLKYNHKLSSSLILQAGPAIQYYLKPIQKKTSYFTAQPTTFGFSIGILFQPKP